MEFIKYAIPLGFALFALWLSLDARKHTRQSKEATDRMHEYLDSKGVPRLDRPSRGS